MDDDDTSDGVTKVEEKAGSDGEDDGGDDGEEEGEADVDEEEEEVWTDKLGFVDVVFEAVVVVVGSKRESVEERRADFC